tara:strand:- start:561 stop:1088 length:528 start_codon:yes stop_codon:yes gene_type:complete
MRDRDDRLIWESVIGAPDEQQGVLLKDFYMFRTALKYEFQDRWNDAFGDDHPGWLNDSEGNRIWSRDSKTFQKATEMLKKWAAGSQYMRERYDKIEFVEFGNKGQLVQIIAQWHASPDEQYTIYWRDRRRDTSFDKTQTAMDFEMFGFVTKEWVHGGENISLEPIDISKANIKDI